MKNFLPVLAIPLLCFSSAMPAQSGIELKLSDDRAIDVDLAEAELISELRGYAIIAGRTCIDCDENTAIFLEKIDHRQGQAVRSQPDGEDPPEPEEFARLERGDSTETKAAQRDRAQAEMDGAVDGVTEVDLSGERFTYPGKYRDYLTKELVEKTRMFYGKCHENSPALLWLSEYRTEKGWVKEEYLLVFRDEGIEHRYNQARQPSIYYIENEDCRELKGVEATTEP
ncbi:hypothetical protein [Microbulbifer hydrolyticus]|uniref:SH3 domain-containing protein n=1 Tax=Microbulbifer hydrolyticus TaxID=48074 RepID=A0A6P1T9L9_9GAMM|nr:hypothetical protein [Microbulbifer hydrolyticus]MBB5212856.1 hypothetical protein [Microbulbifer hydrolyticus]QHQ38353.1 hypothetical protein GTQ55_04655 [Microbulbifer hydrolyticus]